MKTRLTNIWQVAFAVATVGGLFALQPQAFFDQLTRSLLIGLLQACGIHASGSEAALVIGQLTVPWTRDCSGMNLLVILLALVLWVNRSEKVDRKFALRALAVLPAALLANMLRVLTLIGFRQLLYPAVESPQLHYFIGFIWLVPAVLALAPRGMACAVETVHAAAVMAWLSPLFMTSGGAGSAIVGMLFLSQCRMRSDSITPALIAWMAAGLTIGLMGIESLWLPWLLVCPLTAPQGLLRDPRAWLGLAATHPGLTWIQGGQYIVGVAAIAMLWRLMDGGKTTPDEESRRPGNLPSALLTQCVVIATLCLPFTASSLLAAVYPPLPPPAALILQETGGQGWELRLPGQDDAIRVVWYAAQNNDRHHSVKVCLKYRGRDLDDVPDEPRVFSDGTNWLREFFIQDGRLLPGYGDYVRATLSARPQPGAHVIFVARQDRISAADFDQRATVLATHLLKP